MSKYKLRRATEPGEDGENAGGIGGGHVDILPWQWTNEQHNGKPKLYNSKTNSLYKHNMHTAAGAQLQAGAFCTLAKNGEEQW